MNASPGPLQTVNYPSNYISNTVCIWKITAPVGHVIMLHFKFVYLQQSSPCAYDYTEIRNGLDGRGQLLAKFCKSIYDVFSTGRYMWVKFRSDLSRNFKGFDGVYSVAAEGQGKPNYSSAYPLTLRTKPKLNLLH